MKTKLTNRQIFESHGYVVSLSRMGLDLSFDTLMSFGKMVRRITELFELSQQARRQKLMALCEADTRGVLLLSGGDLVPRQGHTQEQVFDAMREILAVEHEVDIVQIGLSVVKEAAQGQKIVTAEFLTALDWLWKQEAKA